MIEQTQIQLTYDTARPRRRIFDELIEIYQFKDLVRNLVRRNVTARYKRSILGILWTLLDPLMTMTVMAIIYGALFSRSISGFPVFLLSGIVVWNYFAQSSTQAMADLVFSGPLIGRVYFPKSVFSFAAVGTGLINLSLSLIPLTLFMIVFGRPFTISLLYLPVSLLLTTLFTLGIGLMVSALAVFFVDMMNIYRIGLRLLMYLSGIFYTLQSLPGRLGDIIGLNPTYHMVELFRFPIYEGRAPPLESVLYFGILAIACLIIGLWVFTRLSDEYVYRV
jgi:ABC-type polysaccharide/polyol phosphate export permease